MEQEEKRTIVDKICMTGGLFIAWPLIIGSEETDGGTRSVWSIFKQTFINIWTEDDI